jgi:hypothetical protein
MDNVQGGPDTIFNLNGWVDDVRPMIRLWTRPK